MAISRYVAVAVWTCVSDAARLPLRRQSLRESRQGDLAISSIVRSKTAVALSKSSLRSVGDTHALVADREAVGKLTALGEAVAQPGSREHRGYSGLLEPLPDGRRAPPGQSDVVHGGGDTNSTLAGTRRPGLHAQARK